MDTFPTYQWRFNGGNIPGATSSSFTIAYVQTNHAGNYSVTITNQAGWAISTNATLTVLTSGAVQFISSSNWVSENASNAVIWVSRTGGSAGPGSVYYDTADGTAIAGLDYQQTNGVLTWNNGESAAKAFTVSIIDANLSGSSTFFTAYLHDAAGVSLGNPNSTIITIIQPPLITQQPQSQIVTQGTSAIFSVAADSDAPLTYQWRFNGTNILAATNSTFAIDHVQPWQAGIYSVEVSNSAGSVISDDAQLDVIPDTRPVFLSGATFKNESFQFVLNGPPGTYVIEVSMNLASWGPYSTNVVPPSGMLPFSDNAASSVRRFYRARLQ